MKNSTNLQDIFLNNARKMKVEVEIYLVNGFKIRGFVKGFDNFTVILDTDGKQSMLYKHAITTISPKKPLIFNNNTNNNDDTVLFKGNSFFI